MGKASGGLGRGEVIFRTHFFSLPKEELSWKSPFEVYYGRKPFRKNDISEASTAQEWKVDEEAYERLTSSPLKDYKSHDLQSSKNWQGCCFGKQEM